MGGHRGLLHLVQRRGAWAGCGHAQSPPQCTECNSPPINGQCTNFIFVDVVPNVTAYPSTANVPTLYLSMWHYNCTLKGQRLTKFWLKWETQMDLNLWTASTNARNKVTLSTMIGTLALDGSDVTFSTPNRGLGGWASQPLPSLLYQMKHQASVVYQPLVPTLLASVPTS